MKSDFEITEECTLSKDHPFYSIFKGIWKMLYEAQCYAKRPDIVSASQERRREILARQGYLWNEPNP